MADTVKSQGKALREIEKQLQSKVSGTDMVAAIHNKVNVSDVSKMLAEIQAQVEDKQSTKDIERLLEDRVTK